MDSSKAESIIDQAWMAWSEHIEKPILRVWSEYESDIVIKFDRMDGRGGTLGQAEYPAVDHAIDKSKKSVIFDAYDVVGSKEGTAVFDFFTIAVHEFGHSLGLRHCDDDEAIMYWQYNGGKTNLRFDDIAGIRERYNPVDFTWKDRRYKYVTKQNGKAASKDFRWNEFYTKCSYSSGHYVDSTLIVGIQSIRSHYRIPIKIISSYRTLECNNVAGGASRSQHLKNNALDWKFTGRWANTMHQRYQDDIRNKGIVFQTLFRDGVRGFGTYATSNHIDTRQNPNMLTWAGQFYNVWGKSNDMAFLAPDYFGVEDCE